METIKEIVPFAKEMLHQRPGRGMLKIYFLGGTLALIGLAGALVETVCTPFLDDYESDTDLMIEKSKKQMPQNTSIFLEAEESMEAQATKIKAKVNPLMSEQRKQANRLHAS